MKVTSVICLALLGLSAAHAAESKAPFKMTVQLDWVAEPEHGGFYQSAARGYFRE
jgi:NitT/TauT family transport system substrate-binding protein